jgi:hypothetical protein
VSPADALRREGYVEAVIDDQAEAAIAMIEAQS